MDRKKWSEKDYLDLERIDPEFPQELIDSFIKPDIPPYNTVEIVGIRVLRTDSIVVQNANGQVVNLARGIGTDKENVRLLQDSMTTLGWDTRQVPPIVEESDLTLYDGYSRHEALLTIGQDHAFYLVVRRKPEYAVVETIDEIGLGANNHPQCKKHTIVDFKKRFAAYVIRRESEGSTTTLNDGLNWFDSIPNSFSDDVKANAIEDVFQTKRARETVESFTKPQAEKKGKELLNTKSTVFAFGKRPSKDGRSHYRKRMIADVIEKFVETGEIPKLVGFCDKYSAEEIDAAREELIQEINELNKMFHQFIGMNKATKGTTDLFQFEGFIPQVIDEETELVK